MSTAFCTKAQDTSWTAERLDRVRTLWAAGASQQEIADTLGVTRNAIAGKISRLDLTRARKPTAPRKARPPRATPERKAAFRPGPVAPTPPVETPRGGQGVRLFDLTNTTCRWPKGSVGDADFCFCGERGADLIAGKPYCPPHTREARRA